MKIAELNSIRYVGLLLCLIGCSANYPSHTNALPETSIAPYRPPFPRSYAAPSGERGCIGVSLEECVSMLSARYETPPWTLSEIDRAERLRGTRIIPDRSAERFVSIYVATPDAPSLPWRNPNELIGSRRRGIHEVTLSLGPNAISTSVSLEIADLVYISERDTEQQYDRSYMWPLINDIIPSACRFASKEEFYRFFIRLGSMMRGRRSVHSDSLFSISSSSLYRAEITRCGYRWRLFQSSGEGVNSAGSWGSSSTNILILPPATQTRR